MYLDFSATSGVSKRVLKEIEYGYKKFWGNPSSVHKEGIRASCKLEMCRGIVAGELGVDSMGLIFTSGATESNNIAMWGKRCACSGLEHPSVLRGAEKIIGVKENGLVDLEELSGIGDVDLFCVSLVNSETGIIQGEIEKIVEVCHSKGIEVLCDVTQAIGHMEVRGLGVDYLVGSAHKIGGPKGVGFLWGKNVKSIMKGGDQERGKRPGTENVPGVMGFTRALLDLKRKDWSREREWFVEELGRKFGDNVRINEGAFQVAGIVNVSFKGVAGSFLAVELSNKFGISVSAGTACTSGSLEDSKALEALGVEKDFIGGSIRICFGGKIGKRELNRVVEAIWKVWSKVK